MRVTNEILSHAGIKNFTVYASFLRDYHGRYFLKEKIKLKDVEAGEMCISGNKGSIQNDRKTPSASLIVNRPRIWERENLRT